MRQGEQTKPETKHETRGTDHTGAVLTGSATQQAEGNGRYDPGDFIRGIEIPHLANEKRVTLRRIK